MFAAVAIAASLVFGAPATKAHLVDQPPSHPVAAAYLYAVFALALDPVDWDGIAERYREAAPKFRQGADRPILDILIPADRFSGEERIATFLTALSQKDRLATRQALTRLTAVAIRYNLAEAVKLAGTDPRARTHAASAQGIYEAFAEYVGRTDRGGAQALGLAWLDLTSILAQPEPDKLRLSVVAKQISDEIQTRFETDPPDILAGRGIWLPPDADLREQQRLPRLVLNSESRGIDERKLFLVAYGDMLFDSPAIYGDPAKSINLTCATCHNRSDVNNRLYIPGLSRHPGGIDVDSGFFNPRANDHRFDPVDTPSLRGIRFTAPYGRDGRFGSLRNFVRNVIVNEFAGPEPTPLMLDALVAYLNDFDFLPAPLLYRNGRLNGKASPAAKRGEEIFRKPFSQMDGKSCASCHIPSAYFTDRRSHDIGSAKAATTHSRDTAFDTPTLLGIAYTAPYFHDGSLPTLASVVDWFNGNFGLGLDDTSKADLTAYLEAVGTGEEPFETFDAKNTRAKMAFEELSVFISTLDTLIPDRDAFHAKLLIRTVAGDLIADSAAMFNRAAMTEVLVMANDLIEIGKAIDAGDWADAERRWAAYKKKEAKLASALY